jgi:methionyl-tRNA synthetase
MGHAYEGVTSDIISRYHRAAGRDVFFLTGTDEHGQKIAESAAREGCEPIDICNKWSEKFQDLNSDLNVSNDEYIRTTMPHHKENAQRMFMRCKQAGDIYKGIYKGWYNVKEEQYVTDTDAQEMNFKDDAGNPLQQLETETYFFKMSAYCDKLIAHYVGNPDFLQPAERYKEIFVRLQRDGLRDLAISRPKEKLKWGIPIPEDDGHVMYVWFDALTNYLSGINAPDGGPETNARYWPANVHIIGKDIIWFHCVIWPCMLMSAGVPLPKCVFAHGFVNAPDGSKMSKSIGNTVDPLDLLEKYDSDSIRHFIALSAVYGSDLPFSECNMVDIHNAHLADGIGNLVHRATNMIKANCGGSIPDSPPTAVFDLKKLRVKMEAAFAAYAIQDGCMLAMEAVRAVNKYITDTEPFKMKSNPVEQHKILRSVLEAVYILGHVLYPFIPDSMDMVFKRLGHPQKKLHELSVNFDNLTPGTKVDVGDILFAKLKKFECPLLEATLDQFVDGKLLSVADFKAGILDLMPGNEDCCLGLPDVRVEVCNKTDTKVKQVRVMIVVPDGKAAKDEQALAQGTVDAILKKGESATFNGVKFTIKK